jgi:glycosyltransferase involved in cell wall biosynthesis
LRLLYTAAHGGYAAERVPLGGGGAVCDQLVREWTRSCPFPGGLELLTPPVVLGAKAPAGRDLVRFSEMQYARFCRDFERACTAEILKQDPAETAVLVNDVSEGPDFRRLAEAGFRVYTIYHVDVVAYVADIYARGWLSARTLARAYEYLHWAVPDVGKLVFQKQKDCVLYSRKSIVPSEQVKAILRDCYPQRSDDFVEIVPWGTWAEDAEPQALQREVQAIRQEFGVTNPVVLTLSRISPEKGQDRLLEALRGYTDPIDVFVCGQAAFMQGERHLRQLRLLTAALPEHIRVHFPGHVTGIRKAAFFALADVYVFPSRHESYGLTLLEALHAGVPAVCFDHQGARDIVDESFGCLVGSTNELRQAIALLLRDAERRSRMASAARDFARRHSFSTAASRIAALVMPSADADPAPPAEIEHPHE